MRRDSLLLHGNPSFNNRANMFPRDFRMMRNPPAVAETREGVKHQHATQLKIPLPICIQIRSPLLERYQKG